MLSYCGVSAKNFGYSIFSKNVHLKNRIFFFLHVSFFLLDNMAIMDKKLAKCCF